MKVEIAGKGGSGKSTIAALLAKSMAEKGYKVLVIDGDVSNFGLNRLLGMEQPETVIMDYFGGDLGSMLKMFSPDLLRSMVSAKARRSIAGIVQKGISEGKWTRAGMMNLMPDVYAFKERWGIDDIPGECRTDKNGITFVVNGKYEYYGQACTGPMGMLLRATINNMDLKEKEVLIVDTDAGIGHFGLAIEDGIDIILVAVDPTYESLTLWKKMNEMVRGIDRIHLILNRVDDESKRMMLESLNRNKIIATIPANKDVFEASLVGEELNMHLGEIDELVGSLEGYKNDIRTK